MTPLVSVVLPVRYVNFDWLKRSISSVLEQDYPNLELIVVNDDATENIDELIISLGIVKYVKNDKNRKLPYSLNRGFQFAEGAYHTWTSADNYMLPGMISRLVCELEQRRDLSVVCGRSMYIDEHDTVLDIPGGELSAAKLSGCDVSDNHIERRYTYYSSLGACFLYRKELGEYLGGYDERLHGSEDYDFWIRASRSFKMGRIAWSEPPLYMYCVHTNSISSTVPDCYTKARLKILEREARLDSTDRYLRSAIDYYRGKVAAQEKTNVLWQLLRALRATI